MYSIIAIHKGRPASISPLRRLDATHNQQESIVMSQSQYTAIARTRLTDLANIPAGMLIEYLSDKPGWYRRAIFKMLSKGSW